MILPADEPFDRLPPHSLESEMCLLASMMLDASCIPAVRAVTNRTMFYLSDHQILWDVLCALCDRGSNIDAVIVREELLNRKLLDEVGGVPYLGQILTAVPSAAHAVNYAERVREKAVLRECIAASGEVLRRAYAATASGERASDLASYGRDRLADAAVTGCSDGFRTIGDLAMEVYEGVEKGRARFVSCGIPSLDAYIGGLQVGGTTMIGGRPGMGKSQMVKQVLRNCAAAGIPCGLVTVEEKSDKVAANCLAAVTGVRNSAIMHGTVAHEMWANLSNGVAELSRLPLYVNDRPVSLADVVGAVTLAATKYKCAVVAVDYLQLIDAGSGDNANREVSLISRSLKNTFKRLGVAGIAAVQLNRAGEGGAGQRPEIRHLRDSGSLEQDGDLIVLLHREDYYHKGERDYQPTHQVEAIVGKNKNGRTGTVPLRWDGDAQTITDWEPDDPFGGAENVRGAA
jgi:replicative DNA helicase